MKLALIYGGKSQRIADTIKTIKDNLDIDCFKDIAEFIDMTLKRRINSHNACDYGHCGCFGVCIDMYYIFVFVLFAFFVFDMILRIELLVINSKSVLNLNVR